MTGTDREVTSGHVWSVIITVWGQGPVSTPLMYPPPPNHNVMASSIWNTQVIGKDQLFGYFLAISALPFPCPPPHPLALTCPRHHFDTLKRAKSNTPLMYPPPPHDPVMASSIWNTQVIGRDQLFGYLLTISVT